MRTFSFTSVIALASIVAAGGCGDLQTWGAEGIAYMPNGVLVAMLEGELRFFDADARNAIGSMKVGLQRGGWIPLGSRLAIASDGKTLAFGAGGTLEVYDADSRQLAGAITVSDDPEEYHPIAGIALSADGSLAAVSLRPVHGLGQKPSRLAVWRISDQSVVTEIVHPAGRESWGWSAGLAFSEDGSLLYGVAQGPDAMGEPVAYVTAWTIPAGAVVWESQVPDPSPEFPFEGAWISSLARSWDGAWLATAGAEVNIFSAADGTHQNEFPADRFATTLGTLHFAPDGQSLVASHYTNAMPDPLVFGLDGSVLRAFPIQNSGCAESVFSPDGTRIAGACPPFVKIWNAQNGDLIRQVEVTVPIY